MAEGEIITGHSAKTARSSRRGDADGDSNDAAERTERDAFDEKLEQDVAPVRADGHADADLAGALGHAHEHDVHNADAADEQRNIRAIEQVMSASR